MDNDYMIIWIMTVDLEFVATEDRLGRPESIDLVPGGCNIAVTLENLPSYLDAQLKYRTMKRILPQLTELLKVSAPF